MNQKKIVIAGGTGFIGREIASWFGNQNNIVVLTRNVKNPVNNNFGNHTTVPSANTRFVEWDGKTVAGWSKELEGADIVINLAGKSVNCRYNQKNKSAIFSSRTDATKAIGLAIQQAIRPPELWINAASATIYRHATDRPQDEYTGKFHNDFSVQVCKLWEKTFYEQATPRTRKVALRMAITLGSGGVMVPYFNLVKFGLGGRQGSGHQMYSWVHIEDVCRTIEWLYDNKTMEGTYNVSAPYPVTNSYFMQTVRKACGCMVGLPTFAWMLKLGALLFGTEPELILKSRWVVPVRLQQSGFVFTYPQLPEAITAIVTKTAPKVYRLF